MKKTLLIIFCLIIVLVSMMSFSGYDTAEKNTVQLVHGGHNGDPTPVPPKPPPPPPPPGREMLANWA